MHVMSVMILYVASADTHVRRVAMSIVHHMMKSFFIVIAVTARTAITVIHTGRVTVVILCAATDVAARAAAAATNFCVTTASSTARSATPWFATAVCLPAVAIKNCARTVYKDVQSVLMQCVIVAAQVAVSVIHHAAAIAAKVKSFVVNVLKPTKKRKKKMSKKKKKTYNQQQKKKVDTPWVDAVDEVDEPIRSPVHNPSIRFTPYAWAKIECFRDFGRTEIGGFGITNKEDPLLVVDFAVPKQTCSYATVEFDDESVADIVMEHVGQSRHPENFSRIWIHTHPGDCPLPSGTDEDTFRDKFDNPWAVMFILACGGKTFCRLKTTTGSLFATRDLPVYVDYKQDFPGSALDDWQDEYDEKVTAVVIRPKTVDYRNQTWESRAVINQFDWRRKLGVTPSHMDDDYPQGSGMYDQYDENWDEQISSTGGKWQDRLFYGIETFDDEGDEDEEGGDQRDLGDIEMGIDDDSGAVVIEDGVYEDVNDDDLRFEHSELYGPDLTDEHIY